MKVSLGEVWSPLKKLQRHNGAKHPGIATQMEKEMPTHSSILAWGFPWTEDPGGVQYMGLQRVGHDWATKQQQQRPHKKGRKKSSTLPAPSHPQTGTVQCQEETPCRQTSPHQGERPASPVIWALPWTCFGFTILKDRQTETSRDG